MRLTVTTPWPCAVALLVGAHVADAHHSQAMFDLTKTVTLNGVVAKFQYSNPHIYVFLEVQQDGKVELLRLEGGRPTALNKLGWSSRKLRVGEKVAVTISPSRDGANLGLLRSLTRADGERLEAGAGQ